MSSLVRITLVPCNLSVLDLLEMDTTVLLGRGGRAHRISVQVGASDDQDPVSAQNTSFGPDKLYDFLQWNLMTLPRWVVLLT